MAQKRIALIAGIAAGVALAAIAAKLMADRRRQHAEKEEQITLAEEERVLVQDGTGAR